MEKCNRNRIYAEIDLQAIADNMKTLHDRLGAQTKMVAVVKADGYGQGAVPIAQKFEQTDYVWGCAVACMDEALYLRRAGIQKPILVLGCVFPDEYEDMIRQGIRGTVYTKETARGMSEVANKLGKTAYLHVKVDTGMGRIGFPATGETVGIVEEIAQFPNVEVEGLFTHFAKADEKDPAFTNLQYDKFMQVYKGLQERGRKISLVSCDNSAGILQFPQMSHTLARAGISMYGFAPSDEVEMKGIVLRPALTLHSHITYVKEVEAGTPISYGGTFVTERKMKIATVPVGYADGYPRSLSNKGEVLIRGKRAGIVGRVCMDQFMVDVTDIPGASFLDPVVLIGKDGQEEISVEELASASGRFHYELLCCLNKRVPRIYLGE